MEDIGDEYREVDLVEWSMNMVFELSNIALMGASFPKDKQLFHDLTQFDESALRVWRLPAFLVKKERALARKLIEQMGNVHDKGMDPGPIIRSRFEVCVF